MFDSNSVPDGAIPRVRADRLEAYVKRPKIRRRGRYCLVARGDARRERRMKRNRDEHLAPDDPLLAPLPRAISDDSRVVPLPVDPRTGELRARWPAGSDPLMRQGRFEPASGAFGGTPAEPVRGDLAPRAEAVEARGDAGAGSPAPYDQSRGAPAGAQTAVRAARRVIDPRGREQVDDGPKFQAASEVARWLGPEEPADVAAPPDDAHPADHNIASAMLHLAEDHLGLDVVSFEGEEQLGALFEYSVEVAVENALGDFIDEEALEGQPAALALATAGETTRRIRGLVRECEFRGAGHSHLCFRFTLVPTVWPLTRRINCRIFQDMSTPEIVAKVLSQYGMSARDVCFALRESYGKRNYCVQYRESDWDFIARLMQEEGIYFFHRERRGHTVLQITDGPHGHLPAAAGRRGVYRTPEGLTPMPGTIHRIRARREVRSGRFAATDYAAVKPSMRLDAAAHAEDGGLEVFDYPGEYRTSDLGQRLARVRVEELQAGRARTLGGSTRTDFAPGYTFELHGHDVARMNRGLLITRVRHQCRLPMAAQVGHVGDGLRGPGGEIAPSYSNEFAAQPAEQPFRSERTTRRPRVGGPQTAVVTGPAGQEIHTDEHGRVKVQFRWDREGRHDDSSSCWIRVSQPWAGPGFGGLAIPRIGQEVIVDFLEGDPDQPIITGRVYNGEARAPQSLAAPSCMTGQGPEPIAAMQDRPQSLPAAATRTSIRSRSTPGGGGANELTMDDAAGRELFHVNATKDSVRTVGNDDTTTVGNDRRIAVGNSLREFVATSRDRHVGTDETVNVEANQDLTVKGNRSVTVKGNEIHTVEMCRAQQVMISENVLTGVSKTVETGLAHVETIGMLHALVVGLKRVGVVGMDDSLIVGCDKSDDIYGKLSVCTGESTTLTQGTDFIVEAGANAGIKAGAKVVVDCPDITLKAGGNFVRINGDGVTIKGTLVKINCAGGEPGSLPAADGATTGAAAGGGASGGASAGTGGAAGGGGAAAGAGGGLLSELGITADSTLGQVLGIVGDILPKIPGIDPNVARLLGTVLNDGVPTFDQIANVVKDMLPEDAKKWAEAIQAAIQSYRNPPTLPGARPAGFPPTAPGAHEFWPEGSGGDGPTAEDSGGGESGGGAGGGAPGGNGQPSSPETTGQQCIHHPGRPATTVRNGNAYCATCQSGIESAIAAVDAHVSPRECFITYRGGDTWAPIAGTGCAHWVAHQKGIRGSGCMAGYALRVPEVIAGTSTVARGDVRVGDIWANSGRDHCGIVVAVTPLPGGGNRISIQHDSSRQGGVRTNDFDGYFGGGGSFHR